MENYAKLAESVIAGNEEQVKNQVREFIASGNAPVDIINQGLIAGMNVVGQRFKVGDMYVPEVLMCARSMNAGLEIVRPLLADSDAESSCKIIIGTVKGDLHDIGKNLVSMMMESGGLEVIDLGVDVSADDFIAAIEKHKPDILAMSALLTTTMPKMKEVIQALEEMGLRDKIKIIIGGAPVSQAFAQTIGADGYAPDAASATELCKSLFAQ
ncbi:corrinoid protein [Desulfosporosinus sp. PR]|uniref:cobalamin B12-binding domain-containing protein n=1 Tax=Candidatus Desulfosporosinus nitrosoreducens TaxID=3401928 RepID=UPI0027F7BC57|nr:corrinoid protein [Desulfosporosinus sp. PR]MDQ7095162.1 corrinoid protein [Desulfosporosinus sp. PR]